MGVIRRIPGKLSRAAKRTLAKFVDFLRNNQAIYDGKALFHADHGNLFTAALDKTALAAHRLAMLKRTEMDSNDRMASPHPPDRAGGAARGGGGLVQVGHEQRKKPLFRR